MIYLVLTSSIFYNRSGMSDLTPFLTVSRHDPLMLSVPLPSVALRVKKLSFSKVVLMEKSSKQEEAAISDGMLFLNLMA
jgi:hypothetical protein